MATRKWSEEQLPIFDEFANGKGHFTVVARAGTGKTTTCNEGISRAPEAKKVYLAFNKRNVDEAKLKISDPRCQVMSLNGLGFRYVLQNWKDVKPDDDVEFDRIQQVIDGDPKLRHKKYPPRGQIREIVAFAKNTRPFAKADDILKMAIAKGYSPEDYQERAGWDIENMSDVAYRAMQLARLPDKQGRISFNDQIWLPVAMNWVRPWFDLVVVDECQDMNATQLYLAQRSVKKTGRLVMIGDPRQAIYAFRGADVKGMERLSTELKAKTFPLTTTYRCPKKVVDLAKILVPDYKVADGAPDGEVSRIEEDKLASTVRGGDAVLSRFNAPLIGPCLGLLKKDIRAYIEGRDIGKTLTAIHQKLPTASITTYLDGLNRWALDRMSRVAGDCESDSYKIAIQVIEDQSAILKALAEDSESVAEISRKLSSLFDDSVGPETKAVVFSSVHKAKGLEWSRVFLIADTFNGTSWSSVVNESQNTLYVALTRAKKELFWVGPGGPKGNCEEQQSTVCSDEKNNKDGSGLPPSSAA
jgi:superfamily I DNA/RNA helicase